MQLVIDFLIAVAAQIIVCYIIKLIDSAVARFLNNQLSQRFLIYHRRHDHSSLSVAYRAIMMNPCVAFTLCYVYHIICLLACS